MAGAAHRVLKGLADLRSWQEDAYRTLHQHPELPNEESRTAATAATTLRDAGYEVHEQIGTTGVVGVLRNGDGPTVLVRADMDAPWRSPVPRSASGSGSSPSGAAGDCRSPTAPTSTRRPSSETVVDRATIQRVRSPDN